MSHFRKTVRMISLGCPKNLVDSEVMLGLLKEKGWVPSAREEADLVVINTCGFIREAKEESIETILATAAGKEQGKCGKLVVTGCLPQRYGEELVKELPEVDLFLGTGEFHRIADLLAESPGEKFSGKGVHQPEARVPLRSPDSPALDFFARQRVREGLRRVFQPLLLLRNPPDTGQAPQPGRLLRRAGSGAGRLQRG